MPSDNTITTTEHRPAQPKPKPKPSGSYVAPYRTLRRRQAIAGRRRDLAVNRRWASRRRRWAFAAFAVDAAMLGAGSLTVLGLAPPDEGRRDGIALLLLPAVALLLLAASRRYRPHFGRAVRDELRRSLSIVALAVLVVSAILMTFMGTPLSGEETLWLWAAASTYLSIGYLLFSAGLSRVRRGGALSCPTLVVGAGRVGHLVARRLLDRPQLGLRPVGFLDSDPLEALDRAVDLPVLGSSDDLEHVVREGGIERVVIAFSTASDELLVSIARRCATLGVEVKIVPRLFEVEGTRRSALQLGGLPLVDMPFDDPTRFALRVKYATDRVLAAAMLVATLPLLALIAAAIRLRMGKPILHRQQRVGRDAQIFAMLKFRTMSGDASRSGEADADWAAGIVGLDAELPARAAGEDRTTPLGRLLRRYSLDELPQLFNVLRGEMSIVGPRPERVSYVERFNPVIYRYAERHRMKPGITGWAQVNGLRGRTSLADRVEWDNHYVENWSGWLDLRIMLRTFGAFAHSPADEAVTVKGGRGPRGARRLGTALRHWMLLALAALVAVGVLAGQAVAAAPSDAPSAVDQYVETIPGLTGPTDPTRPPGGSNGSSGDGSSRGGSRTPAGADDSAGGGGGSGDGTGANGSAGSIADSVSPAVRARIRELPAGQRQELERLTSPALGATERPPRRRTAPLPAADPSAAGAALSAVNDGDGTGLLLLALMGITVAAVGWAAYERRRPDALQ